MNLPQLTRIYLEDYLQQSAESFAENSIRLIVETKRQRIELAKQLYCAQSQLPKLQSSGVWYLNG